MGGKSLSFIPAPVPSVSWWSRSQLLGSWEDRSWAFAGKRLAEIGGPQNTLSPWEPVFHLHLSSRKRRQQISGTLQHVLSNPVLIKTF